MKTGSICFILLLTVLNFQAKSQTYSIINNQIGLIFLNNWSFGGAGVSFYDFDNDGWDDLSFPSNEQSPRFYRNNGAGFFTYAEYYFNVKQIKHITWADIDNDGDNDIFMSRYQATPVLLRNLGNLNFNDISVSSGIIQDSERLYGHSWGDYNGDGFLDLYVANFDSFVGDRNYFYENNGNGTFTEKAIELGIDNSNRPSFQSVWFDYDNDGWQDLYVINDLAVHPNALYRNNGNGTFTDVSVSSGAGISIDAMSSSIGDYNRDGWFDIYLSNLPAGGNRLLRNLGNSTFENVEAAAGASVNSFCWGTNWLDFDNDGDLDVFSAASLFPGSTPSINYLYSQTADNTFVYESMSGFQTSPGESYGSAVGDYNNDGYPDVAIMNRTPTNAQLWANSGGTNNWLKVTLQGTVSNRNAIGSKLAAYVGENVQYKYTLAGDNYLGQDSQHLIFGLGDQTMLDSLVVRWPSGLVETFYQLGESTDHQFIEGETLSLSVSAPPSLCPGDSVLIWIEGLSSIQWSTGVTSDTLVVFESGIYGGSAVFANSIVPFQFGSVEINFDEIPVYTTNQQNAICHGDSLGTISLNFTLPIPQILWNTGSDSTTLNGLQAGIYSVTLSTVQGCQFEDVFEISQPDSIQVEFETTDAQCFGLASGTFNLNSSQGGTGELTFISDFNPDSLVAGVYTFEVVDQNDCFLQQVFEVAQPDSISIILNVTDTPEDMEMGTITSEVSGGIPPYDYLWTNGITAAEQDSLATGVYGLWVVDSAGCAYYVETAVAGITNVNDLAKISALVFPTPFMDVLNVSVKGLAQIRIYAIDGREVFSGIVNQNVVIVATDWPAGMYTIAVTTNHGTRVEKALKL